MPLRVATWNLNGLDEAWLDERTEAACLELLLRTNPPDVVLLQEVVRRSWHAHLKHHFHHAGFVPVPADPTATTSEYFCVILVRDALPVRAGGAARFPGTHMGRALVEARVAWEGPELMVLTSHFESGRASSRERIAQASLVAARLLSHDGPAVFGGDTNLRKAEEGAVEGLDRLADAWVAAGSPKEARATWPTLGGKGPGARFDRVWVRGLEVASLHLRGVHAVPEVGVPPSDHVGLEVVLRRVP